ncbi:MAG: putative quinol monooxygenase [Alphaproteobacteria bacterium]
MLAVIVDFEAHAGKGDEVREVLQIQARNSLEKEPGCRQFDLCADPDDPHIFFLYEVYDDQAAIDAHGQTEHYAAFRERIDPLLKSRNRRQMDRL